MVYFYCVLTNVGLELQLDMYPKMYQSLYVQM